MKTFLPLLLFFYFNLAQAACGPAGSASPHNAGCCYTGGTHSNGGCFLQACADSMCPKCANGGNNCLVSPNEPAFPGIRKPQKIQRTKIQSAKSLYGCGVNKYCEKSEE